MLDLDSFATPQDVRDLIRGKRPEEILDLTAEPGADAVVARVFQVMTDRYRSNGEKRRATILWKIRTPAGQERRYGLAVVDDVMTVHQESTARANATISCSFVDFLRLVAGELDIPRALLRRQLRVSGDFLLVARLPGWLGVN
jgi:putative sterol carrier protein